MQNAVRSGSPSGEHGVLIQSIGSATLTSAAAVAKGLGISAAEVVNCLYKAPAILVDKVERGIAEQLTCLLRDIGYEVAVIDTASAPPATTELFDVALYLKDADKLPAAVQRLASFIGMSEQEATKILLQPPGMALGSISAATVNAFSEFMGDTVELTAASQNDALFDVFLGECPAVVRKRLLDDITSAGITPACDSGLIAAGVARSQLDALWQRHKTNSALRIIHQDFLRFDIVLPHAPANCLTQAQMNLLESLAGIPADILHDVVASAPVTLLESVPSREVAKILEAFAQVDLPVTAELITFQALGIKIVQGANLAAVNSVLTAFGIDHQCLRVPETIPNCYPEIQARVIRDALERAGATVGFVKHD